MRTHAHTHTHTHTHKTTTECLSLSSFNIHSCVLHPTTSDFLICEILPHASTVNSHQIVARRQTVINDTSFTLAEPRVILTGAPPLQLLGYQNGVCLVPTAAPYPSGFLLFWAFDDQSGTDILKPYIWNSSSTVYDFNLSECESFCFRDVALRTARIWNKVRCWSRGHWPMFAR